MSARYTDHAHTQKSCISGHSARTVPAMTRCSGTTRKGTRCTITSASDMNDNSGRPVAQPLRRGGDYCALHAKPFVVRPAATEASLVVVFLDLETTGVDVAQDRIVELAALHAPADHRLAGGSYSSTVRVDPQILKERGTEAAAVHGISDEELELGPNFVEAWGRFLQWTEDLLNASVQEVDPDTDEDEPRAPQLEEMPVLLLAAHNGVRTVAVASLCVRGYVSAPGRWSMYVRRCASTSHSYSVKCCVTAFPVDRLSVGFLWTR